MKHILFFDIDGTLSVHGKIPERNKKALEELKRQGDMTFICTGRAPFYAQELFGNLVSGIISCNGRYICFQGKKILGKTLTQEEIIVLKEKLKKVNGGGLFVSDSFSTPYRLKDEVLSAVKNEYGEDRILMNEGPYYTCDVFYDHLDQRNLLIKSFQNDWIINDHGGHGSCDMSTRSFDKGHAIRYILDYLSLSKEQAYAFGDGYNDQAMFREVHHKIAMGNGVEQLKRQATYITGTVDNDGIYQALKHYDLLRGEDH